jgi:hypothetical protein
MKITVTEIIGHVAAEWMQLCTVSSNLRKVSSEFSVTFPVVLYVLYSSHIKHLMLFCKFICVKHKGDLVRNVTGALEM